MTVLHHLAQAAAFILLLELLAVLFMFLGLAGGLAWGLHWVRGKTDWAFDKINTYVSIGVRAIHQGTDYAARPLIKVEVLSINIKVSAQALKAMVRDNRRGQPQIVVSAPPALETVPRERIAGEPVTVDGAVAEPTPAAVPVGRR